MKTAVLLSMVVFSIVLAESETQTDWSGGPGVSGPVTDWQNRFDVAGAMDWDTEPGQLKLIVDRSENLIASADAPYYVIAVDMDQDGDMDAAGCSYNSSEVFWVENTNGEGTAWTKHVVGSVSQPRFIAVADFDNNGYRDIVASSGSEDCIVLFRYTPGGWSVSTTVASGFDARQIRAEDIDGDGFFDIVGVSSYSGDVCWWKNDGTSTSWNINYIDGALIGAHACDVGDFNGDGHPDVAAASNNSGDVVAYLSQAPYGYSWSKYTLETSYYYPVAIATGDYDNDGLDDFAVASAWGTGSLRWYKFQSTAAWTSHEMQGATAQQIYDISAQDMDGDGYPDILAASLGQNRVVWFKNKVYLGDPWETYDVATGFSGALGVSSGDMDGDGVPDVLACAYYGDKLSWWRVSGFTTPSLLTSSILSIEPPDPNSVEWDYIHWSKTTPAGTSVMFRLKTSFDSGNMGPWSAWITQPGDLASVISQGGSFLQYQVRLATSNPNATPSLKDVSILWNPVSIEDEGSAPVAGSLIWLPMGNPVSGAFEVAYRVEWASSVDMAIYDSSGRRIHTITSGEALPGEYSSMVEPLPAGAYVIVMNTPGGMAARRVVVTP